jgi:restriction system protein
MPQELPKYHETFNAILKVLEDGRTMKSRELEREVEKAYYADLGDELRNEVTSSGARVISDRISWGKSYLKMGKFLEYPKRGLVQITAKGLEAIRLEGVDLNRLKADPDFLAHREAAEANKLNKRQPQLFDPSNSPQDLIDSGITELKETVLSELLEKLQAMDPFEFEKIILVLLKQMGYGEFTETSKTGDFGIDGIINEDKLGLEKIYTQAKRYNSANKVREPEIRNFIGAMSGDTRKGVFITTSTFDSKAIQKAKEAHHTIILIDGFQLTRLMFEYNVGVQVRHTYEVKELDLDFFE